MPRRAPGAVSAAVAVIALATVLVGCGDSGDTDDAGEHSEPTTTTVAKGSDAASAYVGLSKQAAIAKAEADGRPWRIGREDDEQFAVTFDYIPDRVTFEIDDGKVTSATPG